MALELDSRYPGRFNPGNAAYPQGSFKNRTAPGALDGSYLEQDWANDKEGFFQRLISVAGITPNGIVDTATASQYYDALLAVIAANAEDKFNSAIATVASAANVNLTTGAPDTSQIAISGTGVNINGFTVAANRFFVVKMTGATNTLVNSASLVTGRGANIPVVAGDSFLMRSTAATTVEIVCGTFQIDRIIGSGQTWQNLTASRAADTLYTNTTGRSIALKINTNTTWPGVRDLLVNGVSVDAQGIASTWSGTMSQWTIVPPGATYQYGTAPVPFTQWMELR